MVTSLDVDGALNSKHIYGESPLANDVVAPRKTLVVDSVSVEGLNEKGLEVHNLGTQAVVKVAEMTSQVMLEDPSTSLVQSLHDKATWVRAAKSFGKRNNSCPPYRSRSVVSGPWSLDWLSHQNHMEASVIFSSKKKAQFQYYS